jgi:hypothetical protein
MAIIEVLQQGKGDDKVSEEAAAIVGQDKDEDEIPELVAEDDELDDRAQIFGERVLLFVFRRNNADESGCLARDVAFWAARRAQAQVKWTTDASQKGMCELTSNNHPK